MGRKQEDIFELYENLYYGQDDGMQPWLAGFVEDVGLEVATRLYKVSVMFHIYGVNKNEATRYG